MHRVDFVKLIARWRTIAAVAVLTTAVEASAQLPAPPDGLLSNAYQGTQYSPYAGRGFPSRVYWGDTHLHTGLSMDAGAFGNTLELDEAYRFARGEEVTTSAGQKARSVPSPWKSSLQSAGSVSVQPPVIGSQQAPGCGHGFGEQSVLSPW